MVCDCMIRHGVLHLEKAIHFVWVLAPGNRVSGRGMDIKERGHTDPSRVRIRIDMIGFDCF